MWLSTPVCASEPSYTGRRSDVKKREQFVHWLTCRGLTSPQQVTSTDVCESHCTLKNKHPNTGHPESQPSPALPPSAAALPAQRQSFYWSDFRWLSPASFSKERLLIKLRINAQLRKADGFVSWFDSDRGEQRQQEKAANAGKFF